LHTRKVQKSARVHKPKGLQMLLLGVAFFKLPMQRLWQQTTYCNSFSTILFYFKHHT